MLIIESNGSKWAGQAPDPLPKLIERLETEPLDPRFEEYGDFIMKAEGQRIVYQIIKTRRPLFGGPVRPIHDDAPYAVRFWGNFYRISAVFSVDTDDDEVIELLTTLVRRNQSSMEYKAAKQGHNIIGSGLTIP